ncbi:helix-turn-helix transcriptional regulator [Actinomadura barringtoniae]|uniref:Helix-turn-helix transcriptional regulator n=1 Tax=Actinomadura barringtoniae TaxID=1427535 RepID=A0A939PGP0_9ACTN|nr:XRE family transcriptional regulator [Actinomadura barringtoniae]MBO2451933.1 helix-turn-helix transcriptional regulator [Actinomadura barringtoniae]
MLAQEDLARVVGGNVRRLRAAAKISLADLAEAGGVSKTTLHGIEQGAGNPTLGTLWALSAALRVPLGDLLEAPESAKLQVVRAGDDVPRAAGDSVDGRLLHRVKLSGTVEVYGLEIADRLQESPAHLPGVQECLVVTDGQVTAGPVEEPVELAAGDSMLHRAESPHIYRGEGRAVLVMLYPDS